MSYNFYLLLHILSIVGWVSVATTYLLQENPPKVVKKLYGLFSLVLLTAGFGLIARTGFSMHSPWIGGKLAMWGLLSILIPIIAKRKPEKRSKAFLLFIVAVCIAAYLGVFHN